MQQRAEYESRRRLTQGALIAGDGVGVERARVTSEVARARKALHPNSPCQPRGVFDMNGDGRPEIIVSDGDVGGVVLSFDAKGRLRIAAESVDDGP